MTVNPLKRATSKNDLKQTLLVFEETELSFETHVNTLRMRQSWCHRGMVDLAVENGYSDPRIEWRWLQDRVGLMREVLKYLDDIRKAK